jgi:enoyl-CoA hydratase
MGFKNVLFERTEGIATIVINRPEKRNALNKETRLELREIMEEIKTDKNIRVLILTGAGDKAFISGSDINELREMAPLDMYNFTMTLGQQLYTDLGNLDIPVIAMINGLCLGGGCELAVACDIRVAADTAKFGQPEVLLGIIPGGGATQRLPRLIGMGKAKELIYTGNLIDAKEAERIGLVNKVVPQERLKEEAMSWARSIAEKSPVILRMAKKAINGSSESTLNMGLSYEAMVECLCFSMEDRKEGMDAFFEKRKPRFFGK